MSAAHEESAGEPTVEILPDADAASAAAAGRIADALTAAVADRGRADWATTGGSTPVGIYRALVRPPLAAGVPWRGVHVWWGDDRFVPRDHPLSNVLPFDQVLLAAAGLAGRSGAAEDVIDVQLGLTPSVAIPASNVHAIPMGQAIAEGRDPAWAAASYERELRAAELPLGPNGYPVLDVVLVGVGPDGHVLSVFPGSPLFDDRTWVAAVPAPAHVEPAVARVTLNPGILSGTRLPLVVVLGAGKANVVARILDGPLRPREVPAQLARRTGAVWILDAPAAARLSARSRAG